MKAKIFSVSCAPLLLLAMAANAFAGNIVVVMAPSAAPLSKDQVAGIYMGRSTDLKPVDLPDANPVHDVFYKQLTGRDMAQVRAVWAKLIFTGNGEKPKELADSAAVKKAVSSDPKAIGYIDKASVDGSVKVVLEVE